MVIRVTVWGETGPERVIDVAAGVFPKTLHVTIDDGLSRDPAGPRTRPDRQAIGGDRCADPVHRRQDQLPGLCRDRGPGPDHDLSRLYRPSWRLATQSDRAARSAAQHRPGLKVQFGRKIRDLTCRKAKPHQSRRMDAALRPNNRV
jgi:hypothetical protein